MADRICGPSCHFRITKCVKLTNYNNALVSEMAHFAVVYSYLSRF